MTKLNLIILKYDLLTGITRKVLLIQVVYLIQSFTAELICDPTEIIIKDFDVEKVKKLDG
jgi:hypothetical protein